MQDDGLRPLEPFEQDELRRVMNAVEPAFRQGVRDRRERLGWSQTRLAKELASIGMHVDGTAITRIESGERRIRLDEAWAISAVMRLPIDTFLPLSTVDLRLRVELLERVLDEQRSEAATAQRDVEETEQELKNVRAALRKIERGGQS